MPPPSTQATQPDPKVEVAQARRSDRDAMRDSSATMEEIALARRHHDQKTGKRVHPSDSTKTGNPFKQRKTKKGDSSGEEPTSTSGDDDSAEATENGTSLEEILTQGWKLVSKCPSLKPPNFSAESKHIGKHFVRKFELDGGYIGWYLAQVTRPARQL